MDLGDVKIILSTNPRKVEVIDKNGVDLAKIIPIKHISIEIGIDDTEITMELCPLEIEAAASASIEISEDVDKAIKALGYTKEKDSQ